ncbi:hypothetical protein Plhal304r1_c055g0141301 [Plasmopara halstedii]
MPFVRLCKVLMGLCVSREYVRWPTAQNVDSTLDVEDAENRYHNMRFASVCRVSSISSSKRYGYQQPGTSFCLLCQFSKCVTRLSCICGKFMNGEAELVLMIVTLLLPI